MCIVLESRLPRGDIRQDYFMRLNFHSMEYMRQIVVNLCNGCIWNELPSAYMQQAYIHLFKF